MNGIIFGMTALLIAAPLYAQTSAVTELEARYQAQGASNFNAAAGEALWNTTFVDSSTGENRSCTTCHTNDLTQAGKHKKTGKTIKPMAPSVNPERLTDIKKIEKWFLRNCKWTLGRECSAQDKGDVLTFLKSL